jgi:serine/threonine protein kinase
LTSSGDTWVGTKIAEGRYKILGRIGQGSMGRVYLASDCHLQIDVVVKFPLAADEVTAGPAFLDRFAREVRSLIHLSHPHIVKVFDVGEHEGHPFVVMEFLAGGSLKDRLASGPGGEWAAMPVRSLVEWLPEVAKALDFVHSQKHIHRDVKPANILFDRHGNAFLGDFGIIKGFVADESDCQGNALTMPGFLVGTPNYVVPEIVMGRHFEGRADQYSLAMTVHEVLSGNNCMEGPTPSATVVNQTMVVPPDLHELMPGVPARLSDAILKGLAKNPADRFENCASLAQEIVSAIPSGEVRVDESALSDRTSRGAPGRVPCPACQVPIPVGREHAGGRVCCTRCHATSQVSLVSSKTLLLRLVDGAQTPTGATAAVILEGPDEEPALDPTAATAIVAHPAGLEAGGAGEPRPSYRRSIMIATVCVAALGLMTLVMFAGRHGPSARPLADSAASATDHVTTAPTTISESRSALVPPSDLEPVEINVAYGTEKRQWLEAATAEFHKSAAGRGIKVNLHGMGSMEAARAVIDGPQPVPIHVWSPASSAYRDAFEREWRVKHTNQPIVKFENLALTPMVFVTWDSRHEAFLKKFKTVTFKTMAEAMHEPGGWGTIASQAEWGRVKLGHTHPELSNSGLLTLVLMAYEFFQKERNLSHADVSQPEFQKWLREFERAVARPGGTLSSSTGTLMRDMVLCGPSQYDCVIIYENLAIDYLEAARDRWGELRVDYPAPNIWNEHPYYILDVPWSDSRQRRAATEFLKFLMSEPIQKDALNHGFRPGNPDVTVRFPESPLVRLAKHGLRIDLPRMCEPPKDDILQELLASFRRINE